MPMDVCSEICSSATDRNSDHHGSCMNSINTFESTHGVRKARSVDELSVDVTELLNIQDTTEDDSASSTTNKRSEFEDKDSCDEFLLSKTMIQAPEKCLHKHATFPSSHKTLSPQGGVTSELSTHGDNVKSSDPSGFRSISLPTHLKPVSAMKGSREKRGAAQPMKLTVKWAPDVYDPVPTSVSHVVTNRSSSKHNKKNSKNKQKHGSKSSRGSKSKDKKQVRKRGGSSSSSMGYKLEHEEQMVDFLEPEPQSGGIDYHVGNTDRLCGSSFMKRYGASIHLSSVAEAT